MLSNNSKMDAQFDKVEQEGDESWQSFFMKLQNLVNQGEIVIGVMLNSSGTNGHIMMITPGNLIEVNRETEKYGLGFFNNGMAKLPRVLECGEGVRNPAAPLCTNVDRNGAQKRLTWYQYKK